jgi:biopolymer transport protein ExbB
MTDPKTAFLLFMETGGWVLWIILFVAFLLWMLIAERYWFLKTMWPTIRREWVEEWFERDDRSSWYAHRIREQIVADARLKLEATVPFVKVLVALCPFLGLLGTVTGMIQVFEVMATDGNSNARAMASGVMASIIPTMAGMVVALSGLYFSARLPQVVTRETAKLADALRYS